jgi:hypothetical protein
MNLALLGYLGNPCRRFFHLSPEVQTTIGGKTTIVSAYNEVTCRSQVD